MAEVAFGIAISVLAGWLIREAIRRVISVTAYNILIQQAPKVMEEFKFDKFLEGVTGIKYKPEIEELRKAYDFTNFVYKGHKLLAETSGKASIIDPTVGSIVRAVGSATLWSYGIGWLGWVAMSPLLRIFIAEDLEAYAYKLWRTRRFTLAQLRDLWLKKVIPSAKLMDGLAERGFSDDKISELVSLWEIKEAEKEKELTKSEILRAFREDWIGKEDTKRLLMDIDYPEEVATWITNLHEHLKKEEPRRLALTQLKKMWEYGIIKEPEFRARLEELEFPPDAINRIVELTKYEFEVIRPKEEPIGLLGRILKRKVITFSYFIDRARKLGYSDEAIRNYLLDVQAEEVEEERKLTKENILKAFRIGMIPHDVAISSLMEIGYPRNLAEFLVGLEEYKLRTKKLELAKDRLVGLFKIGVIKEDELKTSLLDLGLKPRHADWIVEEAKLTIPVRELTKSDLARLFRAKLITKDYFLYRLTSLGYDERDARLLVDLEELKLKEGG